MDGEQLAIAKDIVMAGNSHSFKKLEAAEQMHHFT